MKRWISLAIIAGLLVLPFAALAQAAGLATLRADGHTYTAWVEDFSFEEEAASVTVAFEEGAPLCFFEEGVLVLPIQAGLPSGEKTVWATDAVIDGQTITYQFPATERPGTLLLSSRDGEATAELPLAIYVKQEPTEEPTPAPEPDPTEAPTPVPEPDPMENLTPVPEPDPTPEPAPKETPVIAADDALLAYWDSLPSEAADSLVKDKLIVPDPDLETGRYLLARRGHILYENAVYRYMDPERTNGRITNTTIGMETFETAIENGILQQVFPPFEGRRYDTFVFQGKSITAYVSDYAFGDEDRGYILLQVDTGRDYELGWEVEADDWYPILNIELQYGAQPLVDWNYAEWTDTTIAFYFDGVDAPPTAIHVYPIYAEEEDVAIYPLPEKPLY